MLDDELTAAIQAVRDRVRARHPENGLGFEGIAGRDLHPLHAALTRPRPRCGRYRHGEPSQAWAEEQRVVQWFKRKIARALDWHVREQVEFNRASIRCVQATMEALGETNRATIYAGQTG